MPIFFSLLLFQLWKTKSSKKRLYFERPCTMILQRDTRILFGKLSQAKRNKDR